MVCRVGGGVYTVALESGDILETSLRGRLKLEKREGDQVVIGDRVRVEVIDEIVIRARRRAHAEGA